MNERGELGAGLDSSCFFFGETPATIFLLRFDSDQIVLSAANCEEAFASAGEVFIGANDIIGRDGAERVSIESVFPHPDYIPGTVATSRVRSSMNCSISHGLIIVTFAIDRSRNQ